MEKKLVPSDILDEGYNSRTRATIQYRLLRIPWPATGFASPENECQLQLFKNSILDLVLEPRSQNFPCRNKHEASYVLSLGQCILNDSPAQAYLHLVEEKAGQRKLN